MIVPQGTADRTGAGLDAQFQRFILLLCQPFGSPQTYTSCVLQKLARIKVYDDDGALHNVVTKLATYTGEGDNLNYLPYLPFVYWKKAKCQHICQGG